MSSFPVQLKINNNFSDYSYYNASHVFNNMMCNVVRFQKLRSIIPKAILNI